MTAKFGSLAKREILALHGSFGGQALDVLSNDGYLGLVLLGKLMFLMLLFLLVWMWMYWYQM